jgi:hypothetical protein
MSVDRLVQSLAEPGFSLGHILLKNLFDCVALKLNGKNGKAFLKSLLSAWAHNHENSGKPWNGQSVLDTVRSFHSGDTVGDLPHGEPHSFYFNGQKSPKLKRNSKVLSLRVTEALLRSVSTDEKRRLRGKGFQLPSTLPEADLLNAFAHLPATDKTTRVASGGKLPWHGGPIWLTPEADAFLVCEGEDRPHDVLRNQLGLIHYERPTHATAISISSLCVRVSTRPNGADANVHSRFKARKYDANAGRGWGNAANLAVLDFVPPDGAVDGLLERVSPAISGDTVIELFPMGNFDNNARNDSASHAAFASRLLGTTTLNELKAKLVGICT